MHNTRRRRKQQSSKNVTRKLPSFEKLNKCPRSRITGMESYKVNCYKNPVVVKVYDKDNFHLHIELKILQTINGYHNTAQLICNFTCNDDKDKYNTKIIKQIRFCGNSTFFCV